MNISPAHLAAASHDQSGDTLSIGQAGPKEGGTAGPRPRPSVESTHPTEDTR